MGGNESRVERVEVYRKNYGDVDRDLMDELQDNARRMANGEFGMHLGGPMEEVLKMIAMSAFGNEFGYKFCDDGTWCSPPNATGPRKAVSRLCSIHTPVGSQVSSHLRDDVFSAVNLPQWMEANAISDLCSFTDDLVRSDTNRQWRYRNFTRTYDARKEDQDSYRCDSSFVYVNGSLVEDGVEAGRCIVFYMGVYYPTLSQTKVIRNAMQQDAYHSAVAEATGNNDGAWDDGSLERLMSQECARKFRQRFGYEYNDNPPLSCRADGVDAAILSRNAQLGYFQDLDIGDGMTSYLDRQLFQGLDIGLPSLRTSAIQRTAAMYQEVLQGPSDGRWRTRLIDNCYTPANPTLHPIHENGVTMWFHSEMLTPHGPIWITYIYTKTVFYETLPPEQEAVKSLFRLLCKNLLVRLKHPALDVRTSDPGQLKDMLFDFAKEKFEETYGFEFAGEHTKPPNKKDPGGMRVFAELLQTKTVSVPASEIEDWINAEIFSVKSMMFPAYAIKDIYNDLRDKVAEVCGPETTKEPDFWYVAPTLKVYQSPGSSMGVKHHGLFLYALGDATIEGVHIQRMFVYYLGIFYGVVLE